MEKVTYQAAGGVIIHEGKMLLLDRPALGQIRLPKGHVEPGESLREAALREVREEAGYANLDIVAELGTVTNHFVIPERGRDVWRDETYFLMRLHGDERFRRDDHDAGQFHAVWVPLDQAADRLTYESEKEFARRAIRALTALET